MKVVKKGARLFRVNSLKAGVTFRWAIGDAVFMTLAGDAPLRHPPQETITYDPFGTVPDVAAVDLSTGRLWRVGRDELVEIVEGAFIEGEGV